MKVHILANGSTKIVLVPENDLDKYALKQMLNGDIELSEVPGQMQIADDMVHDAVILKGKTPPKH